MPRESVLSAALTATSIIASSSAAAPRVLLQLCQAHLYSQSRGALLLPLLQRRLRPVGGFAFLLKLHLPYLVERWVEAAERLSDFPHHWMHDPATGPLPPAAPTDAPKEAQTARFRNFLTEHMLSILPALVGASAPEQGGIAASAKVELHQAAKLQTMSVAELVCGAIAEIVARWLPGRWSGRSSAQQRWDRIQIKLEDHLRAAGAPAAESDGAVDPYPRLTHVMQTQARQVATPRPPPTAAVPPAASPPHPTCTRAHAARRPLYRRPLRCRSTPSCSRCSPPPLTTPTAMAWAATTRR